MLDLLVCGVFLVMPYMRYLCFVLITCRAPSGPYGPDVLNFPISYLFFFPKDYDGQPLRHAEQKDVNEFCIHLMHKLERSSKDAGKLIQRVFGGTLVYQIVSRYPNRDRTTKSLKCTLEVTE